jgi:asparagine synthase (glutamine-hydrolysing)
VLQYLDNPGNDRLQRQLYCDTCWYLVENILCKVDLMSMATSLETRVPYLDNEVVDLVLTMPSRLKSRGRQRKYNLKKAYAQDLPLEILSRGKQGFSIPLKSWLNEEWNELMHDVLNEEQVKSDHLFNWETISLWMRQHESGTANHSHILWGLMVFHLWKNRFLVAPKYEATPAYLQQIGSSV